MATITTIVASTDSPSSAVGIINTNFSNLNTDKIEANDVRTLTNKTISALSNTITNLGVSNIATASKSGADATIITGTKGSTNELAKWNVDGDIVTAGVTIETSLTNSATKVPTSSAVYSYIQSNYNLKSMFVPVVAGNTIGTNLSYDTAVGNFPTNTPDNNEKCYFIFRVPPNFTSLTSAKVVMIPDTTETIQWDCTTGYASQGELYTTNTGSITDATLAVTINVIAEADISSALSNLGAGDYVGVIFTSNTTTLRVLGLHIEYA